MSAWLNKSPPDHGDSQGTSNFRADPGSESQWKASEQRGHGGHHDRPEAQQAGFIDGVGGILAVLALALKREIHHHDSVLFHNSDQQDDADNGDDAEVLTK